MGTSELSAGLLSIVERAALRLTEGGLIIYPTETFYGIGAAVSRPDALARLASLKGREGTKPLPVIAADAPQARALWAGAIPAPAQRLIDKFWPGPLTIVLPGRADLAPQVASTIGIGVRVSSHPVARELARRVGPIAATSANPAGGPERNKVPDIERSILSAVDAVVDAGETPGGAPSTVIGFSGDEPVILREGAIARALIESVIEGR